jgi:secreted trypsin-like serine protease
MLKTLSCLLVLSTPAIAGTLEQPVVGGTPAQAGEWPDVVLVVAPEAACTGTLIAPDVVLTAGHCIETHPALVLVDTVDYGVPGGEPIRIKSATAYPDWQDQYDVGVLVLEHTASAKPRAIASACTVKDHLVKGAPVELVGFGLTSKSGMGMNTRLHEATLPVTDPTCASNPYCNAAIAPGGEFVAGGMGTDSCFGDSGGPLYVPTQHGPALIGVVSRGVGLSGAPCGGGGIYVRADKVVPWIEKVTGRKLDRSPCDGKADGEDDGENGAGGCSIGGGSLAGGALVLAIVAWVLTIPRRRKR